MYPIIYNQLQSHNDMTFIYVKIVTLGEFVLGVSML